MLKNKKLRYICGVLAALSFLMMLGTAGASDCDAISITQIFIQATLSTIAFGVFLKLAGGFEPYTELDNEEY